MRRVLLINVFSTLNKGDAAIAMSQIAMLRGLWPGVEITVQSWNPASDAPRLDAPVVGPFFEMVSEKHPEWSRKRQMAYTLSVLARTLTSAKWFRLTKRAPRLALSDEAKTALDAYAQADLVVSVGGNFLYAYAGKNSFSFLKHCHQIVMAQTMGKPVVLLAQSLGPVDSPKLRRLMRRVVNRSRRVLVREELSLSFLRELGTQSAHIALTPDSAFLLLPAPPEDGERALASLGFGPGAPRVGMTVRGWEYPNHGDSDVRSQAYHENIAKTIDWMIETWGARVILLPQCITPDADDRDCMRKVYALVRNKEQAVSVEDDWTPGLLKAICGRLDLFVGTRMHSNIFATAMHTPTLAISYQPKTDGIMKMLGMERWRILIEDVTFERLQSLLTDLWAERKAVRQSLAVRVAEMQLRALNDLQSLLISLNAIQQDDNATPERVLAALDDESRSLPRQNTS